MTQQAARPAPTAGTPPASARQTTRTWSAIGVALWLVYLALVVLLPDAAGALTAPHGPLLIVGGALTAGLAAWVGTAVARPSSDAAAALARRLPWIVFGGAWFIVWQLTTAKSNLLKPPYFASPEVLLQALGSDWRLLVTCLGSSALLFLTGYAIGSAAGFVTGLLMGWSRRADYWLHPLLQTVGPVPAAALLPLAVLLLPTTYLSAAFIVAFGAWFPMATMTRSTSSTPS